MANPAANLASRNLATRFVSRPSLPPVNTEAFQRDFFRLVKDASLTKYNLAKLKNFDLDINQEDADGKTALYYAVLANNLPLVKLLVEAGADVNKRIMPGNKSIAHLIIDVFENIRKSGPEWYYTGINNNYLVNSNDIKRAEANLEKDFKRQENNFVKILEYLLKNGLELDSSILSDVYFVGDSHGKDAFIVLLELGVDPDATIDGEPLVNEMIGFLGACFTESDSEMLRAILDHGADINRKGAGGLTAIELLARFPRVAMEFPPEKVLANTAWKRRGPLVAMRRRLQESRRKRQLLAKKAENVAAQSKEPRNVRGGRLRRRRTRRGRKTSRKTRKH